MTNWLKLVKFNNTMSIGSWSVNNYESVVVNGVFDHEIIGNGI